MRHNNPLARLVNATRYSLSGLYSAFRQEQAFEYETVVLAVIVAIATSARLPLLHSVLLVGAWLAVMAFELVNSAVERAFDLIDTQYRPEIKAGKDMLSAAVFLIILLNMGLWVAYLFRYPFL